MNKFKGCIVGASLGDAIGLITEFRFKCDLVDEEIIFPYQTSIREFDVNDWSDDTDQMILLLELMIENELTSKRFAKKLVYWKDNGFPELGDKHGMGIGGMTTAVLLHPDFLENPQNVAEEVWIKTGRVVAANGALMRCAVLSFTKNWQKNTIDMCKTTHADPRCIVSCLIVNKAINLINDGNTENLALNATKFGIAYLDIIANTIKMESHIRGIPKKWKNCKYIKEDGTYDYKKELIDVYNLSKNLSRLNLDEMGNIGYTYKCLGCALWTMKQISLSSLRSAECLSSLRSAECLTSKSELNIVAIIKRISKEGGDADTNAVVAGALLGAYIGYEEIHNQAKIEINAMPNINWLLKKIDQYDI
ncbi:MAG: ADP-ribosylglycohydrolase family protein [Candidatus Aenigmarchaeota archaeon]|nr:ADP-ribosylglycohydrolase family protein [Candidatus Aenigmarchaeota archaeon]